MTEENATTRGSGAIIYAGEDRLFMGWIKDYIEREISKNAVWADVELEAGKWKPEIAKALDSAVVAICLISTSFFKKGCYASDTELKIVTFLSRARGLTIIPVIIEDYKEEEHEIPNDWQLANTKGKSPLGEIDLGSEEFREELKKIAGFIAKEVRKKWAGSPGPNDLSPDLKARIETLLTNSDVDQVVRCPLCEDGPCGVRSGSLALISDLLDNKQALGETFDISQSLAILFALLGKLESSIYLGKPDNALYGREDMLENDVVTFGNYIGIALKAFVQMDRSRETKAKNGGAIAYNHFRDFRLNYEIPLSPYRLNKSFLKYYYHTFLFICQYFFDNFKVGT